MSVNPTEKAAGTPGPASKGTTDDQPKADYEKLEAKHEELKDELTTVRKPDDNSNNSNKEVDEIEKSLEDNPFKKVVMEEIKDVLGRMGIIKPEAEKPKPSILRSDQILT